MSLPDLSALTIGESVFDHLAKRGGGKDPCNFHEDHIVPLEERDNPDYKPPFDKAGNCATEGYLMYKKVPPSSGSVVYKVNAYNRKRITVQVPSNTGFEDMTFEPILGRSATLADRVTYFTSNHADWIKNAFPLACKRPEGLLNVRWDFYGEDLLLNSEWFYIDPEFRGHLFISAVDNKSRRDALKLPLEIGYFTGNFIYIVLVCARTDAGIGKKLIAAADAVAAKLGADGVALATLSNSAGPYFSLGYEFVSKWTGLPINVDEFVEEKVLPDGRVKRILNTGYQHSMKQEGEGKKRPRTASDDDGSDGPSTPSTAVMPSDDEDAENAEDAEEKDKRTKLQKLLAEAKYLYNMLSWWNDGVTVV